MGGKGGGKQSTTSEPWKGAIPYLIGGKDSSGQEQPGIFSQAADQYKNSFWTPEMQAAADRYLQIVGGRAGGAAQMRGAAQNIANGAFDTIVNTPSAVVSRDLGTHDITPVGVDASARQAQGVLDPTNALSQLLSGQVNTQYLDPLAQTIMTNITRNTQEQVLPGLRSESMGAGQYGSSRQGVAEGLALSRMNQDLSTGLAPVYAQAFENAQNRKQGTASELNIQAERVATGNADRNLDAQKFNATQALMAAQANADRALNAGQFNANLTLQGNNQNLAANQANKGNLLTASDLYGQAQNFEDLGFNQFQQILGMPSAYNRANLAQYAGIVTPGAGIGGTTTSTAQQGRNPIAGAAGGAMMGASIGGGTGAAIGGILGLITGLL